VKRWTLDLDFAGVFVPPAGTYAQTANLVEQLFPPFDTFFNSTHAFMLLVASEQLSPERQGTANETNSLRHPNQRKGRLDR
jgi:hypothetical protein